MSEKKTLKALKNASFFDAMMESGDASELSEVLNSFFTAEKDIELKTEVHKPRVMSILDVLIDYVEEKGLEKVASRWKRFRQSYLKLMVSYNRGGRVEMVEILKELKDDLMDKEANWE